MCGFKGKEKYQQVKIIKTTDGFLVKIGCKRFINSSWKYITDALDEYWDDPMAAQKKYCVDET